MNHRNDCSGTIVHWYPPTSAPLKISGTAGSPSLKKQVRVHSGSISISSCIPSNPPTVTGVGSLTTRPGAVSSHATRSLTERPTPGSEESSQSRVAIVGSCRK